MRPEEEQLGQYCVYPPQLAQGVDISEQTDAGLTKYLVRNATTSRYFFLKSPEYKILSQFDGATTLAEVAAGRRDPDAPRVSVAALVRFLQKLESLGLLARGGKSLAAYRPERGLYIRFHLFNPDRLLMRLDRSLGWALTKPSIAVSFVLMFFAGFGLLTRFDDVSAYAAHVYEEYGIAAMVAAVLTITLLHEFAHGLACKHFGGDVREMGVLLIYYVLPAFYCNVTDIYRVGRKRERLWVIFAGIYWQLAVSAAGALLWLLATPYTLLADLSFLALLGGTFNILINCNPLIKLDGYYALSQALGVVNLQARSSEYVRSLIARIAGGPTNSKREPARPVLYLSYWLCSVIYSLILIWLVLGWIGGELMDALRFLGVLLTVTLAALLTEKWWKPALIRGRDSAISLLKGMPARKGSLAREQLQIEREGVSTMPTQALEKTSGNPGNLERPTKEPGLPKRGKILKLALGVITLAVLIAPWEASTGSDCTLVLPPEREGVVRANTGAVLAEAYVQPGDAVNEGARIARLANPEIEDRLTQLTAEIDRLNNNNSRIEEDLRVRSESMLSANFKEFEHRRLANELKNEASQIAAAGAGSQRTTGQSLPPSLAVLQSEIDLKQIELDHNRREVDRYKKLFDQGLVGEQIYDRAVAEARLSEAALSAARARLEAALVDHRRLTTGAETSSLVAETESRAARSNFESLIAELHANRQQIESLRQRYEILKRESEGMAIVAPQSGVILGEDLRKMIGRHYERGDEICRVGEVGKFLLEIDVSEREIASVRLDSPVRFKLKTVPGRVFSGRVSKINAEPIPNQRAQRFYPVEVIVENSDGLLRPGMTGFARISFGRQSIGLILAEKVWQALRPELWLF